MYEFLKEKKYTDRVGGGGQGRGWDLPNWSEVNLQTDNAGLGPTSGHLPVLAQARAVRKRFRIPKRNGSVTVDFLFESCHATLQL